MMLLPSEEERGRGGYMRPFPGQPGTGFHVHSPCGWAEALTPAPIPECELAGNRPWQLDTRAGSTAGSAGHCA